MKKKIFKNMCVAALFSVVITALLISAVFYGDFSSTMKTQIRSEAEFLKAGVQLSGIEYLSSLGKSNNRITLIDGEGNVLFDNEADSSQMENHLERPEVQQALTAGAGQDTRFSQTISEKTVYYAVKLTDGSILRVAVTTDSIFATLLDAVPLILAAAIAAMILAALLSRYLTGKIVSPINQIDLDHPGENKAYDELAPFLSRINRQNETIALQMRSLKEKQEEFTSITENMSEGFLVIDQNTNILSYNTSALRLLDADASDAEEHRSALNLNRSAGFRKAVDAALEGNRGEQLLRLNGRCFRVLANPVFRENEVMGAVVVILDVTEQEERENLRREFTANVSHELKTPLTSISGFAEIIQGGLVKPEDIPRFAGNIYQESQRLISLVDDILNLSRLDEENVELESEEFDLYSLSKDVADRLKAAAKPHGIILTVAGESAKITGVKSIVDEMLFNLCDNAVKYNKEDGRVTITVQKAGSGAKVCVTDTGIGIPAADKDRVFERFYRVDKSHSKEIGGTGLGLSIVKHGAAFHNAKITLDSTEGVGTTVTILFP